MSFISWFKDRFKPKTSFAPPLVTTPQPPKQPTFALAELTRIPRTDAIVNELLAYLPRYQYVARITKIPAVIIGIIHHLEADFNFKTCLHNGDPLPGPTTHVPKGRGPFHSWEDAAIDALKYGGMLSPVALTADLWLYKLEEYNGLGYRKHNINSPYIWSGTQYYTKGKYASDGKFDESLVSQQIGAAAILKEIQNRGLLDLSVPPDVA